MKETIIPANKIGIAKIEHFTVNEHESKMSMFHRQYVPVGDYTRLYVDGILMMSNTSFEQRTNHEVVRRSHGHVLIAGLGIGMILTEILEKPEVETVTVIEKYQDVIDLVLPHFNSPKLKVVCADIMNWKPEKEQKYNTIYFDIWPDICTDNLDDIVKLHRRGKFWKDTFDSYAWMDSWMHGELKRQRTRDKRQRYAYGW